MKYSFFLILVTIALSINALPNNMPPPVIPRDCGPPDCQILSNRYHQDALFPHPDPNRYYQCAPYSINAWRPMERYCICGTVFNPKLSRCTFFWSDDWEPICEWQNPPALAACDEETYGHKDKWMV
ncbi:hypothetical protein PVAND_001273 [Polypedilum vanderplanki]|uniref:Chitin-binding type-2 domain-containing protein n=1 Tax=Polypedilum vanderplanki TaxID=319348 RepID=A0A9J6BMZ7_POLVA|nr:hypothetical protein PVAND_001273 [Polypedilum vanderplanki]